MAAAIFVNLPVADLSAATAFYQAIGATIDPRFSGETSSSMVLTEGVTVMLLTHRFFGTFTPRPVADAHAATEVLLALPLDSRDAVDALADKAVAAGGAEPRAAQDMGFMYGRAFEDLDGHIWELMWMDLEAAMSAMAPADAAA